MVQSAYSVGLISRGWKLGVGEAGGGGDSSRQSVTKGGSSPKSNPFPFYILLDRNAKAFKSK